MAEFKDVRTTIRDVDSASRAGASGSGSAHIYLGVIAFLGFAIGAGAVLFLPRLSTVTPSPPLSRLSEPVAAQTKTPAVDYQADPEQLGKAADNICLQRAQARQPSASQTPRLAARQLSDFDLKELVHFNELLHCLLTEQPVRYCSATQRRMITAEIVTYFHGLDHLNKELAPARKLEAQQHAASGITEAAAEPDARVIAAIEARLRDGLLMRDDFDQMKTKLPPRLRERLAVVPRGESRCPPPPWWAVWR